MAFANAPHAVPDSEPTNSPSGAVATTTATSCGTPSPYQIYCELLNRVMGRYCNDIAPTPYPPPLAQFARQCARMQSSRTVRYRAFMRPPESERWSLDAHCADLKESTSDFAPLAIYTEPPLE